jgi:hypothetical protein
LASPRFRKSFGTFRIELLSFSLQNLYKYYNQYYNNDVYILHEDYTDKEISYLDQFHSNLIFVKVSFVNPDECSADQILRWINGSDDGIADNRGIGYRYVQKYWGLEIMQWEMFDKYDFFTRLDDDSFLLEKIHSDFGEYMNINNLIYAYRGISSGVPNREIYNKRIVPFVIFEKKLFKIDSEEELARRWKRDGYGIGNTASYNGNYPYNNYFTMDLRVARKKVLKKFVKLFECQSLKYFWNEGTIQILLFSAIAKKDQIKLVTYFDYQHNFHKMEKNSSKILYNKKYMDKFYKEVGKRERRKKI